MDGNEMVRQLRQLADLRAQGTLTSEEFGAAKARLLNASKGDRSPAPPGGASTRGPGRAGGAGDGQTVETPVLPATEQTRPPVPPPPSHSLPPFSPVLGDPTFGGYRPPGPAASHTGLTPPRDASRPAPTGRQSGPALTVLVGGAVAFLSFLALPMASVPLLGSITGVGLASHASDEAALGWLWLVLVASVAVTGLGAWQCFGTGLTAVIRRRASIAALVCACVIVLVYLIVFASVQDALSSSGGSTLGISTSDLLGAGFWFVLIGAVGAAVGAVVQLVRIAGERR